MKGRFSKNIQDLISEKDISVEEISEWLKIPKSSLKNLMNNNFDNFSYMSLVDISKRLSEKTGENISFIKYEEKKEESKDNKTTKRKSFILPLMIVLITISSIYIVFVAENVLYYRKVLSENKITIQIENKNAEPLLVNNTELSSNSVESFSLSKEENLVINNNNGVVIIKTPNSEYEVKLEDFEVIFKNGEN
jgi:predicted XRE-type DNA-binding protein